MSTPHPFDLHGIDRVRLRELLDTYGELTDEELVDTLLEKPVPGVSVYASRERDARALLLHAVKDERGLMALGHAVGHDADPRYLARGTRGHASKAEFFRQLDELVDQSEGIASRARDLRQRLHARMGDNPTDDDPARELPGLVGALEDAWANARRVAFVMRRVHGGLPPWEPEAHEGEEWKE